MLTIFFLILYLATPTYFRPSFVVIFTSFVVNITSNLNYFKGNYYDSTHPRSDSLSSGKNGVEGDWLHQMKKEQNDLFCRLAEDGHNGVRINFCLGIEWLPDLDTGIRNDGHLYRHQRKRGHA